jgi:hypothetical protein
VLRRGLKNAENQVFVIGSMVHKIAKERKNFWCPLYLIDDDEPFQSLERELRCLKLSCILRILEVEESVGTDLSG